MNSLLLALLTGCGTPLPATAPQTIQATEAFDVPPPPGHRTLRLTGAVPVGLELGTFVRLRNAEGRELAVGDLVLDATDRPSLTVYIPEARADAVLDAPSLEHHLPALATVRESLPSLAGMCVTDSSFNRHLEVPWPNNSRLSCPMEKLSEVFPDIFWMQGTVRMGPGVTINRAMVVLRHEGELTVVNAIRPADPAALDALGRVVNLVKIGMHGMDDAWYRSHYSAKLWAAEGVEGADIVLGGETDQPVPWVQTFQFTTTKQPELALLADREGGVLITCDSVQNWPDLERCSFLAKGVSRMFGFTARPAQIGPPWRRAQTPDGGSLRYDFERLVEMPFEHLIGGHGKPLVGEARDALRATVEATFPSDS